MIINNMSKLSNITSNTFCNCKAAYSAGMMNGMFYMCITFLLILVALAFYFKLRGDKNQKEGEEKEEEEEEENEMPEYDFYNGEET